MFYKKRLYISWKNEATRILLTNDAMRAKLKEVKANRTPVKSNTKRSDFTETTYKVDTYGDYAELYMMENGRYVIYCNNMKDNKKNDGKKPTRVDRLFNKKFMELNGVGLQAAYGFADKCFKRNIPKQFMYIVDRFRDRTIIASSVDASSQYPSGCLGTLPDFHKAVRLPGTVKPTKEYPFAFYASGHLAIYNELDTHEWASSPLIRYLFRFDKNDKYRLRPEFTGEKDETILMGASPYKMDETWNYFYTNKQNCVKDSPEYELAKLVMNQVIGDWHRKDKDEKRIMSYDDGGSYQLAHIVAVAIARGNQKLLDKIDEIGIGHVVHVCVDGIIYVGDQVFGAPEAAFGKFTQEFVGKPFKMRDLNVYCVRDDHCIKFRHSGYDLLDGQDIDETKDFTFEDLYKLDRKERIGDIIKNG